MDLKDPLSIITDGGSVIRSIWYFEECAYAALFLVSDEASYVTATPMLVDGGAIFS